MPDFTVKATQLPTVSATLAPVFDEGEVVAPEFIVQTIRDPNSGKLCLTSAEFIEPQKERSENEIN